MDQTWRPHLPPPPIQGRICPPLPPPPPFPSSNPSYQYPPPLPPHVAAPYDPFIDHRGGPPIPPPSRPTYGNPSYDCGDVAVNIHHRSGPPAHHATVDSYEHHPRPSDAYGNHPLNPSYDCGNVAVNIHHHPMPPPPHPRPSFGNLNPSYDPFNVGVKTDHRGHCPTIDGYEHNPRPSDAYGNVNPSYDYGNANVGVKRMRVDDSTGQFMSEKLTNLARFPDDNERRLKLINEFGGADHELDKGNGSFDAGEYGKFDGFLGGKSSNSSFVDPGYRNLDKNQRFHDQERFDPMREGNNGQFGQLGYDDVDNNLPRKNGYKYGDSYHNVEHDQQNYQGSRYSSKLGDGYLPRHGVSGLNKLYHEQTSCLPMDGRGYNHHSEAYAMQNHMESKSNHYGSPYDHKVNSADRSGMSLYSAHGGKAFANQPPLPASPPPPLPMEPPLRERLVSSSPPGTPASLFPVSVGYSAPLSSYYPPLPEEKSIPRYQPNLHLSSRSAVEEVHMHRYTSSSIRSGGSEHPLLEVPPEKSKVIDAKHILKHPYRATRPDHLVVILRGLPGSGKSYLAKMLRDLEVENGGTAPRIHSMDDYFMTEVDKVEESEVSRSSGSIRGKKMVTKKVMEYCYEPEMEEAYRSSMLKAFTKTLGEGAFSFVIVDDRNLRVADFAQFWATAKRSGYEVYLLDATYKDPAGCAARNVHGFTRDDVQKMAGKWEEAPSMYLKLDVKSLLHGDALEEGGIQEVDMDMEDDESLGVPSTLDEENIEKFKVPPQEDVRVDGDVKDDQDSDHEEDHRITEVKGLAKSKWSSDLDEDDTQRNGDAAKNLNALSGLIQSYRKEGKSVRWGDQVTKRGFSIGAAKATNVSLVIGPGAGYNLKSNPLPEGEKSTSTRNNGEPKRQSIFQERLRAERESFRAVFESFRTGSDKRRQRIVGLNAEDE
ncbi:uncharacterized protein LOC132600856 [Lycium barbarum]|uniref:uncharacterized protein LOC132600856 n=1 Tax=Lycium barbarum TaxID=112863 RepID=UPI00293E4193|nr:uncharacterized protein LOC132600856 [Lycium barbarum]